MKTNTILDAWFALSRGQRRATLVLAVILVIVSAVHIASVKYKQSRHEVTTEYDVLQEEFDLFRRETDTAAVTARPRTYRRKTRVEPDTAATPQPASRKARQRLAQPRSLELVPRLEREQ